MTRRADVANAILGNGSLLATLSARGEVESLAWPHIDRDQHLGELRLGVVVRGRTRWLDEDASDWQQRYEPDAMVLVTTCRVGELEVSITDLVVDEAPVLARAVRTSSPVRLATYLRPSIGGTGRHGSAYVDRRTGSLVAHRRDQVLAIASDVDTDAGVGERQRTSEVLDRLASACVPTMSIAHGEVEGGLVTRDEATEATVAVAFGATHADAIGTATATAAVALTQLVSDRVAADSARLDRGAPSERPETVALYRRSQLVFDLLTDRSNGGVIAGPEVDVDFLRSGGYGFVWGRDVAFTSLAFTAAGRHDLTSVALRWLARHQEPDGLWLQRHWTDGTLAPSWGTQLDETGAAVVAYDAAYRAFGDDDLDAELWPSARRAAEALIATISDDNDLPVPSMDPWEERFGQHTYTAACHVAGLRAAARMAQRHDPTLVERFEQHADRVATAIDTHLWSEEHGRFLRGVNVGRGDDQGDPVPAVFDAVPAHPGPTARSVDAVDAVPDVSLLGLAWPLGVIAADDPRMKATAAAIAEHAGTPDGGVMRYPGDRYMGGNPWILATLWTGLYERAAGDEERLERAVRYTLDRSTSTDLLPEQVDVDTGAPVWVLPLTWSHAMLVLASRPDPVTA